MYSLVLIALREFRIVFRGDRKYVKNFDIWVSASFDTTVRYRKCCDKLKRAVELTVVQGTRPTAEQIAVDQAQLRTPKPLSMTHRHLLSCLNTFLENSDLENSDNRADPIRILDVGCGDGLFIKYLVETLSVTCPERNFEIFGMDVHDHGVQVPGYWAETLKTLTEAFPSIDWRERLKLVSVADPWPFPDGFFDVVISNQVLEHVGDHLYFFRQHRRVLAGGGAGFHLFPLHHCIIEPHLRLPLVHWFTNRRLRKQAIALTTRLGMGKFKGPPDQLDAYAEIHADYLVNQVNYKTQRNIADYAAEAGLTPSFGKTHHYFAQKLRAISGRPFVEHYPQSDGLSGRSLAMFLRYISSATLEVTRSEENRGAALPANTVDRPHS